ncbi:MAG TPA: fumarylacetoacetate hydrolase family protein [Phycisphaerae bacterium]|nr:fumarylacetoacetate hydrolase family protein [Phycisphaerae bacterium]
MKLATYTRAGRESYGAVLDGGICDVPALWPEGPRTLLAALQAGPAAMGRIKELAACTKTLLPRDVVSLLAPIPAPPKVIGLAGNYAEHLRESLPEQEFVKDLRGRTTPRPFIMPSTTVIGPGATIPWPSHTRQIDHEIELAIVMGETACCVGPADAAKCIAGYTIANDVSARSLTVAEGRSKRPRDEFYDWLAGKWADGFCPTGPYLVTADEVGDPRKLDLELTVNGETRQNGNTSQMIFDVYEVVSFVSHLMTLTPGDVIATGTPSGVGIATGRLLKGGDVIACRIDKIGELANTLSAPPERFYRPCKA